MPRLSAEEDYIPVFNTELVYGATAGPSNRISQGLRNCITLLAVDDNSTEFEGEESFTIVLASNDEGVVIMQSTATVIITDVSVNYP